MPVGEEVYTMLEIVPGHTSSGSVDGRPAASGSASAARAADPLSRAMRKLDPHEMAALQAQWGARTPVLG